MTSIEKEKIARYITIPDEMYKDKTYNDFIHNQITLGLMGYVYAASKEQGEFIVYVQRPTFLDWLLRRDKTITVPYTIRQLIKKDLIPDALPIIDIKH